jgi:LytS/YehU family sensor histidine kinase
MAGLAADRRIASGVWTAPQNPEMLAWKGLSAMLVYATVFGITAAIEQAGRAGRAETLRAQAQLEALRARLNPHFILNLLHTLMGLVAREPRAAETALERLGGVLQYALRVQSQGLDEVRLAEEWEFVDRYLALERLRLGERLQARLDAEPGTLEAVVPAFSLQPLVENAVRHAIAPRAAAGRVLVSARRGPDGLILSVEDDGDAARDDRRAGDAHADSPRSRPGLGLRLIRDRLQALYGEGARLETGRSSLGGFRAAVVVPWEPGRTPDGERSPEAGAA